MYNLQVSEAIPYKAYPVILKKGEDKTITLSQPAVILPMKGEMNLFSVITGTKRVIQGQVFILPREAMFNFSGLSETVVTIIEVPDMTALATYFLQGFSSLQQTATTKPAPVPMDKLLEAFRRTLTDYMKDSTMPQQLIGIKVFELFYILSKSLQQNSFRELLDPVISDGYHFAQFVLANYTKAKNVEELAALSHYSLSGFDKQFRKIFGIAPYKWMLKQKANRVFHEILQCTKPLKVIAEEYDFCNLSHLGDFCRKHFGASPSTLREKNKL